MRLVAALIISSIISISSHAMGVNPKVKKSESNLPLKMENIYTCDDGLSFELTVDSQDESWANINVAGDLSKLISQESGSGVLYSNNDYELFMKGDEAELIYIDEGKRYPHKGCKIK